MRVLWRACFLIGILVGVLSPAFAQTQSPICAANAAVPPVIRPDGLAELVGDVVIVCQGTSQSVLTGTLQLAFTTTVTSRLTSGATSEALLLIDEPASGTQVAGVNLFQGDVTGPNVLTFANVPLFPASAQTTTRILRLTNVRIDALGFPAGSQIVSSATFSGISLLLNNPLQTVAFVGSPSTFSANASGQCANASGSLDFAEAFSTQFKVRGAGSSTPGVADFNIESGFVPNPAIAGVGLADTGTELSATFAGLPDGAQVAVPAAANNGGLQLAAISPAGGGSVLAVGGTATVVYEVTAADAAANDSVSIPFTASGIDGNFSVQGSLAPASAVNVASDSAPIPRFSGQGTAATVIVAACATPPTPAPATSEYALGLLVLLLILIAAASWRAVR